MQNNIDLFENLHISGCLLQRIAAISAEFKNITVIWLRICGTKNVEIVNFLQKSLAYSVRFSIYFLNKHIEDFKYLVKVLYKISLN